VVVMSSPGFCSTLIGTWAIKSNLQWHDEVTQPVQVKIPSRFVSFVAILFLFTQIFGFELCFLVSGCGQDEDDYSHLWCHVVNHLISISGLRRCFQQCFADCQWRNVVVADTL
jgi:hypothetical protein